MRARRASVTLATGAARRGAALLRAAALAGALAGAAASASADDACGGIALAARKVEWLGHDIVIDGAPAQAALLTFDLSSEQVAAAFAQAWRKQRFATRRRQDGSMLMVSALSAQCSYTLQLPPGRILLDMTSRDGGKLARTVQMSLPAASPAQASADYAARLRGDGWRVVAGGPAIGQAGAAPFGYALAMQKHAYRLDAAFARASGSTSVVINVSYE